MSGTQRGRDTVLARRAPTRRPRAIPEGLADVLADAADAATVCREAQADAVEAIARRDDVIAAAISEGASRRQVSAATGLSLGQVQTIAAREAGSVTS